MNDVIRAMRPSTREDLYAVRNVRAVGGQSVRGERWQPVGAGRHHPPVAGSAQHSGREESEQRVAAGEPGCQRRHLQLDVGADEIGQLADVRLFEDGGVAVEQVRSSASAGSVTPSATSPSSRRRPRAC